MHDTAHDLTEPSLGKNRNDDDLWCSERIDDFPYFKDELLSKGTFIIGLKVNLLAKGSRRAKHLIK